ncbi:hypothetical protein E7T09_14145 [Deinococcus sp. KSM4-11]|uniref:DUF5691 domain-containing protein n=1 Tax=Deinococcus sp. KSM4-11 TaxID=2568654 RepID=UPI0010A423D6|nr:DUF5691 domain-containing protein [Deinococcus sp. KSM4-11]THF85685.1 hypothetical protein E7T09_14145 [Deinococcus sp. KSM4-11]
MSDLETLLALALVGTARGTLPTPGHGALDHAAAQVTRPEAEGTLLARAVLHTLAHAAGRAPDPASDPPPAPAPAETLPEVPERAARHLPLVLGTPLLREWLALCARTGWRVPPARLPELLDLARHDGTLRAALSPVLGERGAWLSQFNPEWRFTPPTHGEDAWAEATEAGREALWRGVRERDPQAARDLLTTHLPTERAGSRKRLLGALLDTLTPDDQTLEPLLDSLTTDRSDDVRTLARTALHRLSGSAQNARNAARIHALVTPRKTGLIGRLTGQASHTLTPPTAPDEHATRDGLPDKPGATELLTHLLEHTHPDSLLAALNLTPEALSDLAKHHDVIAALASNARATGHSLLATALLRQAPGDPGLLATAGTAPLHRAILAALPARQPDTLLPLLDALPAPWPQEIGTQVVTALRDTIPDAHYAGAWGYRWSQILDLTAQRTHPHTPPPAPLSPNATEYAHRVMNELRATLELRRQLSHDFGPGAG